MKVCHVISDLDVGGAERMLVRLLGAMDRNRFEQRVVALIGRGPLSEQVEALGVPLDHLDMRRGAASPGALLKLRSILKRFRPDVVQTWLYHADLIGLIAAGLARRGKVVWNLRCSDMDLAQYRRMTSIVLKINAKLSGRPAAIISNSRRALEVHRELGYRPSREEVIPNGFDLSSLKPDPGAGARVREELDIPPEAPVVGMVARFDPMKGHETFFQALGLLRNRLPDAHFVLAGEDISADNANLSAMYDKTSPESPRLHLLGRREDVTRLMNAFTINVVPSITESFPTVAGEAMACGTPCVVTDVGDSAYVVGDTGRVVPPLDPNALAEAIEGVLTLPPEELIELGRSARDRVRTHFSLPAVAAQYEALYESLA